MEFLYNTLRSSLIDKLIFLEDKPEETIDSTLRALWLKASGNPVSAKKALKSDLPNLTDDQISLLNEFIYERLNGKPLSHITNRQSFMGIEFISDERALIPRAETEILVSAAIQIANKIVEEQSVIKLIDVCCGSGNVGLSIAKAIKNSVVYSSDLSLEAVELTQENINFLGLKNNVRVNQSDLFDCFKSPEFYHQFDVITCNPPYISSSKVSKMNVEISENEPRMAFDGGMIGMKIISKLISEAPQFLRNEGWLLFELGLGQGPFLVKLMEDNKAYKRIETYSDQSGNIRAIAAQTTTDYNN